MQSAGQIAIFGINRTIGLFLNAEPHFFGALRLTLVRKQDNDRCEVKPEKSIWPQRSQSSQRGNNELDTFRAPPDG